MAGGLGDVLAGGSQGEDQLVEHEAGIHARAKHDDFVLVRDGVKMRFAEIGSVPWSGLPSGLVDMEGDGVIEVFDNASYGAADRLSLERWHGELPLPSEANDWKNEREETLFLLEVPDITMYGCGC